MHNHLHTSLHREYEAEQLLYRHTSNRKTSQNEQSLSVAMEYKDEVHPDTERKQQKSETICPNCSYFLL